MISGEQVRLFGGLFQIHVTFAFQPCAVPAEKHHILLNSTSIGEAPFKARGVMTVFIQRGRHLRVSGLAECAKARTACFRAAGLAARISCLGRVFD